jgi:hypothetical protein
MFHLSLALVFAFDAAGFCVNIKITFIPFLVLYSILSIRGSTQTHNKRMQTEWEKSRIEKKIKITTIEVSRGWVGFLDCGAFFHAILLFIFSIYTSLATHVLLKNNLSRHSKIKGLLALAQLRVSLNSS